MAAQLGKGKRPPLGDVAGEVPMPEPLRRLVEACWAQEPIARPSAEEARRRFDDEARQNDTPHDTLLSTRLP